MSLSAVSWRPPVLAGRRVKLRGYERRDAPHIWRYASDAETTRYMAWERHRCPQEVDEFLDGAVADHYRRRQLEYALCLAETDQLIGGLGLYVGDDEGVAELGYVLCRDYWGAGLMPEAITVLMHHGFTTTELQRIYAPIFAENEKSRRTAEKVGLQFEGVQRSGGYYRGRRWDIAIYAMIRSDFDQGRLGLVSTALWRP